MSPRELLQSTVYLDRGYIADLYEVITGESPHTVITKNQSKKAGGSAYVFSAEVSAQETRSFPVSTFAMLASTLKNLSEDQELNTNQFKSGMSSMYGWIEGELTVFGVKSTLLKNRTAEQVTLAEDEYFQIRKRPGIDLALITTAEYFSSGLDTFLKMRRTLLREMSIPVKAYVRVMAAQSHTKQWIAVPLVILERASGA